jgi:hypothetical protein
MSSDDPEGAADPSAADADASETNEAPAPPKEKKGADGSSSGAKKSKKSKSGEKSNSSIFSNSGNVVEWDSNSDVLGIDESWVTEDPGSASPSVWDPKQFDEQTGSLDPWKESTEVTRVQDLPYPALAEASPDQRTRDEDEWPFKSPCSLQEKRKRRSHAQFAHSVSPDVDAIGSPKTGSSKSKGKKGKKDDAPPSVQRSISTEDGGAEDGGDDDIIDDDDGDESKVEAWKMRESWKSSAHSESEVSKGSKEGSTSRRGRKKDSEPAMPRRSRASRPDADEDIDQAPAQPKGSSKSDDEVAEPDDDGNPGESDKSKKPKRRSTRKGAEESSEAEDGKEDLEGNSFHRLAKDFDKPSKPRSSSRGRKTKTPGSGSGRRRRLKDKALDHSGHEDDDSEVYGEFGEEEHEIKLKDDASNSEPEPGSGGSRSRMSWRERRARNKMGEDPSGDGPDHAVAPIKAPGSAGRRPPRRGMMRRASSERWKRAVEGEDDPDAIQIRARATLRDANAELSRSAHSIRRYHSGGVGAMASGLDTRSYHGPTENRRPPLRTPRKQTRGAPSDSADSGGSFGNDYDDYELNLSGRSARTLDSIEDLEDFGHMDFQTPGMVDYEEEILEQMQRANPENTAQLNKRVHRKREAVNYDQNMPMMTRQALLTRQASAQVARQRFDGSNIDRQRLLLRSDSMTSTDGAGAELSMSNHRPMRTTPGGGRRPPPRTRSSGMAAMAGHAGRNKDAPSFMQQAPARSTDPENRRGVLRTRSSTASFKQYHNKPNRVAQLSRRGPGTGDQIDPHSMRGTTSSSTSVPVDRRRSLQRAKSTTALRPTNKLDPRGAPADHDVHGKKDDVPDLKSADSDAEKRGKKKKKAIKDDESLNSESEDSDVESIEEEIVSPKKPTRRKPTKSVSLPTPIKVKTFTDKRDMLVKRNRCKLHSMMYDVKMGVDMKDLFVEVQKGDISKSPIHALMMPSP